MYHLHCISISFVLYLCCICIVFPGTNSPKGLTKHPKSCPARICSICILIYMCCICIVYCAEFAMYLWFICIIFLSDKKPPHSSSQPKSCHARTKNHLFNHLHQSKEKFDNFAFEHFPITVMLLTNLSSATRLFYETQFTKSKLAPSKMLW